MKYIICFTKHEIVEPTILNICSTFEDAQQKLQLSVKKFLNDPDKFCVKYISPKKYYITKLNRGFLSTSEEPYGYSLILPYSTETKKVVKVTTNSNFFDYMPELKEKLKLIKEALEK